MDSIQGLFSQASVQRIIDAKGIDVSKLPTQAELEKRTLEQAKRTVLANHQRYYYRMSAWSGDIPLRFTFDNWNVQKQPNHEQAKRLGNQAFMLAKQLHEDRFNVALSGTQGVGKTSLALAMMDQLMKTSQTAMFVSTAELLRLANEKYAAPDIAERWHYVLRDMKSVDVLVLDDFGTEGGMPNVQGDIRPVHKNLQSMMYQVANARCDFESNEVKHATIITTNNSRKQLERMYDRKTIDRLFTKNTEHQLLFEQMEGVRNV